MAKKNTKDGTRVAVYLEHEGKQYPIDMTFATLNAVLPIAGIPEGTIIAQQEGYGNLIVARDESGTLVAKRIESK
jgi:hypothetical protein